MVVYTCRICLKKFDHKGTFDSHKNRKNPCEFRNTNTLEETLEKIVKINLENKLHNNILCEIKNEIIPLELNLHKTLSHMLELQMRKCKKDILSEILEIINSDDLKSEVSVKLSNLEREQKKIYLNQILESFTKKINMEEKKNWTWLNIPDNIYEKYNLNKLDLIKKVESLDSYSKDELILLLKKLI